MYENLLLIGHLLIHWNKETGTEFGRTEKLQFLLFINLNQIKKTSFIGPTFYIIYFYLNDLMN